MGDHTPPTLANCQEAVELYSALRNKTECARSLNIPRTTFNSWLEIAQRTHNLTLPVDTLSEAKGRAVVPLEDGVVIVAADFHYWPGQPSTAHRALLKITDTLKPNILVANGDICDFATISRFPPLGWASMPTAAQEIEAAQDRLHEWGEAGGGAQRFWPVGNHDARMETFIASKTPELKGIQGTSLVDHFPLWEPCYAVWINDKVGGLVIKHRFKGGVHAPWNNVKDSGRSMATGHLHSQKVTPFSNYNGTFYGTDVGCIADPYAQQFEYMEDNPRNHRSGFAVFTFYKGVMNPPELVSVLEPGVVFFRGERICV